MSKSEFEIVKEIVKKAILEMGVDEFRKTSFFASNRVVAAKKAA